MKFLFFFFFSSRRRHTRWPRDWSSDVCSSDLGELFSGTRLRFAYGGGIKEPNFEENFGSAPFVNPNPHLKPEQNRSLETGVEQGFGGGKYSLSADYFNNRFTDQIEFQATSAFAGNFINVNRALAHGSEVEFTAHPLARLMPRL